jgi:hypothetical protein
MQGKGREGWERKGRKEEMDEEGLMFTHPPPYHHQHHQPRLDLDLYSNICFHYMPSPNHIADHKTPSPILPIRFPTYHDDREHSHTVQILKKRNGQGGGGGDKHCVGYIGGYEEVGQG